MSEIKVDLNELIYKDKLGNLRNSDFTRIWTDVVCLPIYRIEYIIQNSKHTAEGYDYNNAFFYGMLNRIRMYLCMERRIVCNQLMNLELSSIFSRIILEDNILLQYYFRRPEKLELFRKSCLKAEIALEQKIKDNRNNKEIDDPDIYAMEERMLRSIYRAYSTAGFERNELYKEKLPTPPNVLDMSKEVGLEDFYTTYRIECHATHGDWFDISRYFLEERRGKFYPCFNERIADIRKLNPPLLVVYKSLEEFVQYIQGHGLEISNELTDDRNFIQKFDSMHFNFLNKKPIV